MIATAALSEYHPVVIEGMGGYDPRDPTEVAQNISEGLKTHWQKKSIEKPKLILLQGDPPAPRGVSAITPQLAAQFRIKRGLVCLDEHIAPYHPRDADRSNVILEYRYSQFVDLLQSHNPQIMPQLHDCIDDAISDKNRRRRQLGKPPLKHWFRDFALLQEVTKAASRLVCGGITIAHTDSKISDFSITSCYAIGLELGLVNAAELVRYTDSS